MKIREVLDALERFAPLPLQEDYDNAGLQVGLTETEASGALLCLDVTEDIIDEAVATRCNLIVAHHPLLFHGLKTLSDGDYVQRTVIRAIKNGVTVVAMHTNMDNARGGVCFEMARRLGLGDVRFLVPRTTGGIEGGSGAIGHLDSTMPALAFIDRVKSAFGVQCALCNGATDRDIRCVALCGGAGESLLHNALEQHADAFVTGEMHYHTFFGYEQSILLCVIGHYQSEQYTTHIFKNIIEKACPELPLRIARTNTNPIIYL